MADLGKEVTLQVSTPLGKPLDEVTDHVQVPSALGEFGVLGGHLPLLAALKPGILAYNKDGKTVRAAVGGGFVEAGADRVRLITEFYTTPDEVDVEKANADLATAEERLKALTGTVGDTEHIEAQRDLDWALARIELGSN